MYYAREINPIILPDISTISQSQASPTTQSLHNLHILLDYLHTNPNTSLKFYPTTLQLQLHSDESYLSENNAKSLSSGCFFLKPLTPYLPKSSPFHVDSTILRSVVTSATESELYSIYHKRKIAYYFLNILLHLHHNQHPITITTDRKTSHGFINKSIKPKKSKSLHMNFQWLQQEVDISHLITEWKEGSTNIADYFRKHHLATHHNKNKKNYTTNT